MSRLEIKGARKSFGSKPIIEDISFSCETGEIIGLFGRNGSGKSTLLKAIMGTVKADNIDIVIDNRNLAPSEVIPSQKIGYLPQDSFLPKEMKVREVIPLIFPDGEEQDKIFYSEGVERFDRTKIGKLSAGERKYLEILLLCQLKHPFLLLDEPFSLVELKYIEFIKQLLLELRDKKGMVITDHYYEDVLSVSTSNFVINKGKKYDVEHTEDLRKHEYLKRTIK